MRWIVDGMNVIGTRPERALVTVRECIELGIGHVWMHRAFGAGSVSERDLQGKIVWERQVDLPVACQRLPGGQTFIATRSPEVPAGRHGSIWSPSAMSAGA